jgi:hypothetical protein
MLPFLFLLQAASLQGPYPEVVTRSRLDHSKGVDFHAIVTPETVYVGQQATYQLGVFLDTETRQRIRRNPEFLPPESRALLSYDLPERGATLNGIIDGRSYEVHVFRRALFALTAGRYPIPAARLTYTLPQNPSFFSREESFTLRSEAVTLVAVDPPAAGRPPDWTGAVGAWRASARLDSSRARAGDPFVLTMRVEGQGNVSLLPRPALTIDWASVVPADERVSLDSTPRVMQGRKEFDWLVTPTAAGPQRVPPLRFTYFNPVTRRYEISVTSPLRVHVDDGDVVAVERATPAAASVRLSLRPTIGDDTPAPLGDSADMRLLLLFAPVPAAAAWLSRRPRRRKPPPKAADRVHSLALAAAPSSAADVRRAFQDALQARTGLEPSRCTRPGAWQRALRLEGVNAETAQLTEELMVALDAAAFGPIGSGLQALARRADTLVARVHKEARRRTARARHAVLAPVVLALLGGAATLLAARDLDRAREPFARGLAAYAGADSPRAVRFFEESSRLAPRAAGAWANFGTASWAAGDTSGAVVGWQRALRLDPTSDDLRDRLALVRAPQGAGFAYVPQLPSRLPSALAVLLWCAGWTLVARQCWRRRRSLPLLFTTLAVAGSTGVGARMFEDRLEGRRLAVVTDPAPLRVLPALGSESGAVPLVGEIARIERREGVWMRIALEGGRAGWIPTERVVPLGRD